MKPRFVFNKGQRIGVLGLVLIVLGLLGVIYWLKYRASSEMIHFEAEEQKRVQSFIDSIKRQNTSEVTYQIYPFNPNFISDYKGYKLGMSVAEIDRLHQFRASGKWINSTAQFQRVTGVSDSLLNVISPYFDFPDWVIERRKRRAQKRRRIAQAPTYAEKKDLNTATAEELKKIKGIGEVLSHRIIRYRMQIGGFVDDLQIKDVYGLKYEVEQNLLAKYTVKSSPIEKKKDLNQISVAELTEIPYFDYELARKIVHYRITHEGIQTFEELSVIEGFPYSRLDRVKLYLEIAK